MWGVKSQLEAAGLLPNCQVLEGLIIISVPQGWQEAPRCPESPLWVVSTVHLLPTSPPPLQSPCPSVGLITSSQLPIWTLQWDPGGWCFCRPYLDRWGMERGVFDLYTI